ncbi:hypothetical protein CVT24_009653 [Panaeolus cyanescens]|uniref:Uncharacterized protein n=1 Tax=Panaeolus cyanescens TaxID=181874 RepID=A0A409Y9Z8_9AGAR|nr:hypothetical protein CVT24_009653 [Panaeolus cyanescens]
MQEFKHDEEMLKVFSLVDQTLRTEAHNILFFKVDIRNKELEFVKLMQQENYASKHIQCLVLYYGDKALNLQRPSSLCRAIMALPYLKGVELDVNRGKAAYDHYIDIDIEGSAISSPVKPFPKKLEWLVCSGETRILESWMFLKGPWSDPEDGPDPENDPEDGPEDNQENDTEADNTPPFDLAELKAFKMTVPYSQKNIQIILDIFRHNYMPLLETLDINAKTWACCYLLYDGAERDAITNGFRDLFGLCSFTLKKLHVTTRACDNKHIFMPGISLKEFIDPYGGFMGALETLRKKDKLEVLEITIVYEVCANASRLLSLNCDKDESWSPLSDALLASQWTSLRVVKLNIVVAPVNENDGDTEEGRACIIDLNAGTSNSQILSPKLREFGAERHRVLINLNLESGSGEGDLWS